ncbi:hypothetical protein KSP40_PGU001136 [Platanthera guangdongensis]|uniref:Cytochrome b-c1 complex subunit 7 n=1 Tax=Platanthera guangdongensis TaxID=2320717 RepID=A0ABR2MCL2_9ASPA
MVLSAFTQWLVNPRRNPLAAVHQRVISKRLRNYGLRYDDLYDPYYELDIKEALNRLPREIVDARNQRLKRAMDLSMKHQYLPEEMQEVTPQIEQPQTMQQDSQARTTGPEVTVPSLPSVTDKLQTPFRSYLQDMLALVKKERAEREALGALPLYQRSIP